MPLSSRRRRSSNVLVHSEKICRVILLLYRQEALVVFSIGVSHALRRFIRPEVVHVDPVSDGGLMASENLCLPSASLPRPYTEFQKAIDGRASPRKTTLLEIGILLPGTDRPWVSRRNVAVSIPALPLSHLRNPRASRLAKLCRVGSRPPTSQSLRDDRPASALRVCRRRFARLRT